MSDELHPSVGGDGIERCAFCNTLAGGHDCIDVLQRRLSELLTLYDAREAECHALRALAHQQQGRQ